VKNKKSIEVIDEFINNLRRNPIIVKNNTVPGILTAEMVEGILFGSLYSASYSSKIFNAIAAAIDGSVQELYLLSMMFDERPLVNGSELSYMMGILCADEVGSNKYTLDEWVERITEKGSTTKSTSLLLSFQVQLGSQYLSWFFYCLI
jgi:hypothetical protein